MTHSTDFLYYAHLVSQKIDHSAMEQLAQRLVELRAAKGRLFVLGVGGSAANASHAVNDFRKICRIEAYAPTDNVAELTARTNDDGWDTFFIRWLVISQIREGDALLILSVGGGSPGVSAGLTKAIDYAKIHRAKIFGIVGRDGGFTKANGDVVIVVPPVAPKYVTPLTEAFQAIVWHCLVSHPDLQAQPAKWEGLCES